VAVFSLPKPLPLGWHTARVRSRGAQAREWSGLVLVSPARLETGRGLDGRRGWGIDLKVASLVSERSAPWGGGDLVDLADVAWVAGAVHRADFLIADPFRSRPVGPSRGVVREELIRPEAAPEWRGSLTRRRSRGKALADLAAAPRSPGRMIEYRTFLAARGLADAPSAYAAWAGETQLRAAHRAATEAGMRIGVIGALDLARIELPLPGSPKEAYLAFRDHLRSAASLVGGLLLASPGSMFRTWVPVDGPGGGVWVRPDHQALLAAVVLEAHRAGVLVVAGRTTDDEPWMVDQLRGAGMVESAHLGRRRPAQSLPKTAMVSLAGKGPHPVGDYRRMLGAPCVLKAVEWGDMASGDEAPTLESVLAGWRFSLVASAVAPG
jgi:hypothetical protein